MSAKNVARLLALLFGAFLVLVILAVNLGIADRLFGRVYSFPNGDKIAHFILFGLLGLLAGLGFANHRARLPGISPLISSLVLAALSTLEELSQIGMENRSFEILDLAAGLAGIFLLGEFGARLAGKFHPAHS